MRRRTRLNLYLPARNASVSSQVTSAWKMNTAGASRLAGFPPFPGHFNLCIITTVLRTTMGFQLGFQATSVAVADSGRHTDTATAVGFARRARRAARSLAVVSWNQLVSTNFYDTICGISLCYRLRLYLKFTFLYPVMNLQPLVVYLREITIFLFGNRITSHNRRRGLPILEGKSFVFFILVCFVFVSTV